MDRRSFLKLSTFSVMAIATRQGRSAPSAQSIGLQMYTVRELAEKDLSSVLKEIRRIGYDEVELYWNLYSRPAAELRKMLDDNGLRAPSAHLDYNGFESKLDYARDLGVRYVICPMLPRSMWDSIASFEKAAEQFNRWGEMAKRMGMVFGFHNHNYEFRRFGNTTGFETIVSRTDPSVVCLELDCYWLAQAGHDPAQMISTLGRRVRLIHVKDRKPGFPPSQMLDKNAQHFTEVGTGSIKWPEVLASARRAGVQHYFVEQDITDGPVIDSIATSYRYLSALLSRTS